MSAISAARVHIATHLASCNRGYMTSSQHLCVERVVDRMTVIRGRWHEQWPVGLPQQAQACLVNVVLDIACGQEHSVSYSSMLSGRPR